MHPDRHDLEQQIVGSQAVGLNDEASRAVHPAEGLLQLDRGHHMMIEVDLGKRCPRDAHHLGVMLRQKEERRVGYLQLHARLEDEKTAQEQKENKAQERPQRGRHEEEGRSRPLASGKPHQETGFPEPSGSRFTISMPALSMSWMMSLTREVR